MEGVQGAGGVFVEWPSIGNGERDAEFRNTPISTGAGQHGLGLKSENDRTDEKARRRARNGNHICSTTRRGSLSLSLCLYRRLEKCVAHSRLFQPSLTTTTTTVFPWGACRGCSQLLVPGQGGLVCPWSGHPRTGHRELGSPRGRGLTSNQILFPSWRGARPM